MVPYQPSLPQLGGATQPPPLQVPGRPGGPGGPGELMPGGPGCPGGPVQGGPGGPGGPGRPGGHTAGCVGQGGHWGAGGHTGGGTGSIGGGTGPGVGGTGTIGGGTGQGIIGHAGGIGHTGGLTGVGGYGHWAYCLLKCTLGSRSASKRSSWSTLSPPVLLRGDPCAGGVGGGPTGRSFLRLFFPPFFFAAHAGAARHRHTDSHHARHAHSRTLIAVSASRGSQIRGDKTGGGRIPRTPCS